MKEEAYHLPHNGTLAGPDPRGTGSLAPGGDPSSLEAVADANSKNCPPFTVESGHGLMDIRSDKGTYHKSNVFHPCTGTDHNMSHKK